MLCDKYPLNIDCPQNTHTFCLLFTLSEGIFLLILINYTWKCASICNTCAVNRHEEQTKNIIFQDIYIYIYTYTRRYIDILVLVQIFLKKYEQILYIIKSSNHANNVYGKS